jgi:spore maturation protein CgeB
MANVIYLGDGFSGSTSGQRALALQRLGHQVIVLDPYAEFRKHMGSFRGAVNFRTGYVFLQGAIRRWLVSALKNVPIKPDVVWVDMGEVLGPSCISVLKSLNCPIVNYNVDDPTGKRDGNRFYSFIKSIPLYDLIAVVREETAAECKALGARKVIHVFRSYDEVAHRAFESVADIPDSFRSDVAFIGTWMRNEKRDEFLYELIRRHVPVSIWGDRWPKSPLFKHIKEHWRGNALYGRDYVKAIQGSKICLGMLSKGNRDLHTTRSLEIPYAGGLFCGERTSEHLMLYRENKEAVFWSNVQECADICLDLLGDDKRREQIRLAGTNKVKSLNVGHEDVCRQILNLILNDYSEPNQTKSTSFLARIQ